MGAHDSYYSLISHNLNYTEPLEINDWFFLSLIFILKWNIVQSNFLFLVEKRYFIFLKTFFVWVEWIFRENFQKLTRWEERLKSSKMFRSKWRNKAIFWFMKADGSSELLGLWEAWLWAMVRIAFVGILVCGYPRSKTLPWSLGSTSVWPGGPRGPNSPSVCDTTNFLDFNCRPGVSGKGSGSIYTHYVYGFICCVYI